jgi:predicted nuclease of predicted toxin-antitoxin system
VLRLLSDRNCDGRVVRGLLRRRPGTDVSRVQDVGLIPLPDPNVLEWAARDGRILVTHDTSAVPAYVYACVQAGRPMPGVLVVTPGMTVGQAVQEILLLDSFSETEEWRDRVWYLPL